MENKGEIRVFNPNKEISREITLEVLIRHRNAMKQARTGELTDIQVEQLEDNVRMFNRVRALNLIIAAQREMISISRPIVFFRSQKEFKKKNRKSIAEQQKKEEKTEELNFEEFECDYNTLINEHLELLKACEQDIILAEKTRSKDDDFIIEETTYDHEKKLRLTDNFYEMLEELEGSYEKIYLMMLTNKIVSAGIEDDEELDYKQKEEEAIKRVTEA